MRIVRLVAFVQLHTPGVDFLTKVLLVSPWRV